MVLTKGIQFTYSGGNSFHFPDMDIQVGRPLLIAGRSGCGKTTLLHILAGILTGYQGELQINNQRLDMLKTAQLDRFTAENIGMVYQRPHFIESLTVADNILLAATFARKKGRESYMNLLAEQLKISEILHKKPARLSLGEQQRAGILRALINKPAVVLADEPTSSLDDENAAEVIALLSRQATAGNAALVVVTHDSRLKASFSNILSLS